MEVSGMNKNFFRSEHKHGLIYKQYIGDGDTKTYMSVVEKKPYGDSIEIEKIECVVHIQKRMGSSLRKLKSSLGKKKLSDGMAKQLVGKAASQMLSLTD
ncbi:uncharacterized protein TNCV_2326971 [Trichonephila clavipes]|nr:uncharacterized protein TNCV_2326971 [Trichonephila clavipes]